MQLFCSAKVQKYLGSMLQVDQALHTSMGCVIDIGKLECQRMNVKRLFRKQSVMPWPGTAHLEDVSAQCVSATMVSRGTLYPVIVFLAIMGSCPDLNQLV